MVNASASGSRSRGGGGVSSPTLAKQCCVLEQGTFTPKKVLVIPRKGCLHPNMTEKLFTGTLRINQHEKHYVTKSLLRVQKKRLQISNLQGGNTVFIYIKKQTSTFKRIHES